MQPFKINKMPEQTNAAVTEQVNPVSAPDWSLLNDLSSNQDVQVETAKIETPADILNSDLAENETKEVPATEVKEGEETKDSTKTEETTETQKDEEKTEDGDKNPEETEDASEFKIEVGDIKNAPTDYAEDDWRGVAKEIGFELDENSFDKFKENIVTKAELEKVRTETRDQLFSSLKPETATALELLELGVPEELIFNPTAQADGAIATIDSVLKLTDAELYRKVLENTEGFDDDETIDTEIEDLISSGKLAHKAKIERINLQNDRKTFLQEKEQIVQTRAEIINKRTADVQRAAQLQKEQEAAQFEKALDAMPDFMGVKVPKEVKDTIVKKFRGGLYDDKLSAAEVKANSILFQELGAKFADLIKKSSVAKGREDEVKKNVNLPPQPVAAGQRVVDKNQEDKKSNQFDIIKEHFGG